MRNRAGLPPARPAPAATRNASANIRTPTVNTRARLYAVLSTLVLAATALVVRAVDLQIVRKEFYQDQGDQRFLRERVIPVSRGMITDRNGEPLAVSTPVESIWAQPGEVLQHPERLPALARVLGVDAELLHERLAQRADKEFVYLRRHLAPDQAAQILALDIPGVNAQREFRRYYPSGEVVAHILGFSNIDDRGQEGLELAFDEWLAGKPGLKRIIQNRRGEVVEDVELVRESQPGRDLKLTIDRRIQYLAYRELKAAMIENRAQSGSMVIVDVPTGEILAMVNWPSYNPNARMSVEPGARRNRAVTDVFEPGSVIKTLTVAAGLESGKVTAQTLFDTKPMPVGNHVVRDIHDYGIVDMTRMLTKSSNVAAARIAAQLTNEHLYDVFHRFGLGEATGCGFPGESPGVLTAPNGWGAIEKATLSYGYGLSVTALQLAQVYAALANGGRLQPPTFVHGARSPASAVLDPDIARQILAMLETVIGTGGTGTRAAVPNFSVAGKTGTSRKSVAGGYEKRYVSVFAGVVPASRPRLAAVVVIHDPQAGQYYGGAVAAPVFGKVMPGALRLLNVAPDRVDLLEASARQLPTDVITAAEAQPESPYAEGVAP